MLSVDEKSRIQALDRTQPGLPIKAGRPATMTHDHVRHGTTTLFAALDVLDETVVGRCTQRHRHQEVIRFLNAVEAAVSAGKPVHAIMDNGACPPAPLRGDRGAAHEHPKVRARPARHPRWTLDQVGGRLFHLTPTSCSWPNAVEGLFATLTRRRLLRRPSRELRALVARLAALSVAFARPRRPAAEPAGVRGAARREGPDLTVRSRSAVVRRAEDKGTR